MFALVSMWNRGRETSPNGDLSDDLGSDYFTSNTFSLEKIHLLFETFEVTEQKPNHGASRQRTGETLGRGVQGQLRFVLGDVALQTKNFLLLRSRMWLLGAFQKVVLCPA